MRPSVVQRIEREPLAPGDELTGFEVGHVGDDHLGAVGERLGGVTVGVGALGPRAIHTAPCSRLWTANSSGTSPSYAPHVSQYGAGGWSPPRGGTVVRHVAENVVIRADALRDDPLDLVTLRPHLTTGIRVIRLITTCREQGEADNQRPRTVCLAQNF